MPDNMSNAGLIMTTICFLFSLLVSGFCLFPFWSVVGDCSSLQCIFSSELELSMVV